MKSLLARLEVWGATLIVISACIVMRYTVPGVLRTMVFIASILVALYLIILSFGHAKGSDG